MLPCGAIRGLVLGGARATALATARQLRISSNNTARNIACSSCVFFSEVQKQFASSISASPSRGIQTRAIRTNAKALSSKQENTTYVPSKPNKISSTLKSQAAANNISANLKNTDSSDEEGTTTATTSRQQPIQAPETQQQQQQQSFNNGFCKIAVVGVGGAGTNAVNNMIKQNLTGVDFVVVNTDFQSLHHSMCKKKVQIGVKTTRGLGAGSIPEVGRQSAEEALDQVMKEIEHNDMIFVTAGMGGGTGTGALPIIAKAAKDKGILVVGVVTTPFQFEGSKRMKVALEGVKELEKCVDTLITIPNQNLFKISDSKTVIGEAFAQADSFLLEGVKGIADLVVVPGLINLDFADVRTVMKDAGRALMGTGIGEGSGRAESAIKKALNNPLLGQSSIAGAKNVLLSISGGEDLALYEVQSIVQIVRKELDEDDAHIIFGANCDTSLKDKVKASIVVTGLAPQQQQNKQQNIHQTTIRLPSVHANVSNVMQSVKQWWNDNRYW